MNSSSKISLLVGAIALSSLATAQGYGLKTNIRAIASYDDHHQYQGWSAVPELDGFCSASLYASSAEESVATTYGKLSVDAQAIGQNRPDTGNYGWITHDGNPTAEFTDTLTVTGANAGDPATFTINLNLTNVTFQSGNPNPAFNVWEGLDGFIQVGSSLEEVKYQKIGNDFSAVLSASMQVTTTVGSQLGIHGWLFSDAIADPYWPSQDPLYATTLGTLTTSITGGSFTSASGARYAATPEPMSLLLLAPAALGLLRKRKA